ncbi:hypothetical protein KSP40_PGU006572 [Platanthera guangdongensis]|uniref:Uncharacterized protein n=1 Tax=Platanthera guangdongensis TaxID=2320717 RepID=A0ABR2MMA8_9ASPA
MGFDGRCINGGLHALTRWSCSKKTSAPSDTVHVDTARLTRPKTRLCGRPCPGRDELWTFLWWLILWEQVTRPMIRLS